MQLKLYKLEIRLRETIYVFAKDQKQALETLIVRTGDPEFKNWYWTKKPKEEDFKEIEIKGPTVLIG
jgi:hypothetical protein